MIKILLLVLALLSLTSSVFVRNHDYWYTAAKKPVTSGVPMGDVAWNYCDLKCTYLEKYNPGRDFVVINFSQSSLKPDFAACYVATIGSTGTTYALWNTVFSNAYYEKNCGGETQDYYALTTGASPKYKVGAIEGAGIGTQISY